MSRRMGIAIIGLGLAGGCGTSPSSPGVPDPVHARSDSGRANGGPDPKQPNFYGAISWPLVDINGTVYAGSVDGKMYAISSSGDVVWTYATGGHITESSPALDTDGTLYFTSEDGNLYAIGQ
jgi:outer membrane protein assembly factor BamB